jgi:hypothetical protein
LRDLKTEALEVVTMEKVTTVEDSSGKIPEVDLAEGVWCFGVIVNV